MLFTLAVGGCHAVAGLDVDHDAVIPAGWQGPLIVLQAATDPGRCPSSSSEWLVAHRDLVASPNDSCGCEPPVDACAPTLRATRTSVFECATFPELEQPLTEDDCVAVDIEDQFAWVTTAPLPEQLCRSNASFSEPSWGQTARLCLAGDGAFAEARCIARTGETTCPDGHFSERQIYFEGYQDGRACDCGHAVGECGGTVGFIDRTDFPDPLMACQTGFVSSTTTLDNCAGPLDADYVVYRNQTGGDQCSVAPSDVLTGSVDPASPVTVCCQR